MVSPDNLPEVFQSEVQVGEKMISRPTPFSALRSTAGSRAPAIVTRPIKA
jgi:hypothetical protein